MKPHRASLFALFALLVACGSSASNSEDATVIADAAMPPDGGLGAIDQRLRLQPQVGQALAQFIQENRAAIRRLTVNRSTNRARSMHRLEAWSAEGEDEPCSQRFPSR